MATKLNSICAVEEIKARQRSREKEIFIRRRLKHGVFQCCGKQKKKEEENFSVGGAFRR
jgi:hypothetical protein